MANLNKLIFVLAIIYFFACDKDGSSPGPDDVYLTYKVDGDVVLYKGAAADINDDGVIGLKLLSPTRYVIQAAKGTTDAIELSITTDSLTTTNYEADQMYSSVVKNHFVMGVFDNSQIINISITRYSSGTIDGTFSGYVYSYSIVSSSGWDSFSLTDGEFKNVKILY